MRTSISALSFNAHLFLNTIPRLVRTCHSISAHLQKNFSVFSNKKYQNFEILLRLMQKEYRSMYGAFARIIFVIEIAKLN